MFVERYVTTSYALMSLAMRAIALSNAPLFMTDKPSVLLAIWRIESMRDAGSCSSFSSAVGALPLAV
jgi:hypothetical protein